MQRAVFKQQATFARFEYHCAIGTAFPLRGPTRRLKTAFRAATQCKEITHMKSCRSDRRLCWIKCLICCTATDSDSVLEAARWPTFRAARLWALHVDHRWSLSSSSHRKSERQTEGERCSYGAEAGKRRKRDMLTEEGWENARLLFMGYLIRSLIAQRWS